MASTAARTCLVRRTASWGPVVAALPGRFHPGQDDVRDPVREHVAAGAVPDAPVAQLGHEPGQLVRAHPPAPRSPGQHDRLGRAGQPRPQRAAQHLGHPRVALDPRGTLVVAAADPYAGPRRDHVGHGDLGDIHLAERRQHIADVGQEGAVRPDDQHAPASHPLPVCVEQVRDAVQPHRGLARPRRALHADGPVRAGADDVVLVGLDRGDDVTHRARPGPLDFRQQDVADRRRARQSPRRGGRGCGRGRGEVLVLVRGELAAGEAEPPPHVQPHRIGLAGPVERPGHRGPPVDHHRVAVRVVHMPPSDVERLRAGPGGAGRGLLIARRPAVVQPAEEQRGIRQVAQRLGPPVQVGLEVLLRHGVPAEGAQREHVLAHQPQELPGPGQVGAFSGDHRVGRAAGRIRIGFGGLLV
jgi:hypothetical protein